MNCLLMNNTPINILTRPQIHKITFAILLTALYTLIVPLQPAHAHQPFFIHNTMKLLNY